MLWHCIFCVSWKNQVMFFNVVCLADESFTRYISALFECCFGTKPAAVGFAETRCWFSLRGGWGPVLGCVVLFIVSILFVCVFGLTSALTDVRDGKWRLVRGVFSGLGKGPLSHVSNIQNEQSWSRFAPDRTVWASTWAWSAEVWMLFGPLIHGGVLKQTLWIQHLLLFNSFCWESF